MIDLKPLQKQKGLAALVTAIVLLIAVTIVVIFAAKFGVQELRISANEARHKEAQQLADAGLEQASSFLRQNVSLYDGSDPGWSDCTTIQATFPCTVSFATQGPVQYDKVYSTITGGSVIEPLAMVDLSTLADTSTAIPTISASDGSASRAYILLDNDSGGDMLTLIGLGVGKDGTAYAAVKNDYARVAIITPGEIPPVMAPQLNLNGNFTIVANPNNGVGTTGVPISGWTANETSSGSGSWQTCHLGDFQDGGKVCTDVYTSGDDWGSCACTNSLSNASLINYDIYEDDGFPDPLAYIFGTNDPDAVAQLIIGAGGKYYAAGEGCAGLETLDLSTLGAPMVFVEDACSVPAVGTKDLPVILVVRGKMTINAGTDAWGLLVSVTEVAANGSPVIHGSLVANGTADISNGTYKQVYTPEVMENLAENDSVSKVPGKLPYSWTDQITNIPN